MTAEIETAPTPGNWWDNETPPKGWVIGPAGEAGAEIKPDPSPLEPGVWLWPAYTTTVEPEEGTRWSWETMAWEAYTPPPDPEPEPEPEPLPPRPSMIAVTELIVADGEVTQVGLSAGVGFAIMIGDGVFWVFFSETQPNASYLPFAQSPGYNADVTAREADYLEVTVTDRATNQPAIPASLAITVQRTQ